MLLSKSSRCCTNLHIQISDVLLLGVKVIVVEESPVPSFAWNAYKKMEELNRPDMQKLIIAAAETKLFTFRRRKAKGDEGAYLCGKKI